MKEEMKILTAAQCILMRKIVRKKAALDYWNYRTISTFITP